MIIMKYVLAGLWLGGNPPSLWDRQTFGFVLVEVASGVGLKKGNVSWRKQIDHLRGTKKHNLSKKKKLNIPFFFFVFFFFRTNSNGVDLLIFGLL